MADVTGVVLLNMGGPDSPQAVRPFLTNLFSDPAILGMPRFVRLPLARWIAGRRSRFVVGRYEQIGGKSPLADITGHQARALEKALGQGWATAVAMRYWRPRAAEAVEGLLARGAERFVALSLYPQFSCATSGSSLADLEDALLRAGRPGGAEVVIDAWPDHPAYLDALAETVGETLGCDPGETVILFSAHGLPARRVEKKGDPYLEHVERTVEGVVARLPRIDHRLSFQSRAGPVRWLEPSTEDTIRALGREGVKRVVVVPVSFVSDHIETLHEIDIEYAALARSVGIGEFRRVASLNTRPSFVAALADLVRARAGG